MTTPSATSAADPVCADPVCKDFLHTATPAPVAPDEGLMSAFRALLDLAERSVYPQPDKPKSDWAVVKRARDAFDARRPLYSDPAPPPSSDAAEIERLQADLSHANERLEALGKIVRDQVFERRELAARLDRAQAVPEGPSLAAIRQGALAVAYASSVFLSDGDDALTWAHTPSVARVRELFPDASLREAAEAYEAVEGWAEHKETSAQVIRMLAAAPQPTPDAGAAKEAFAEDECQTCGSPQPHLHPSVQMEGEVELCTDAYHLQPTSQNTPDRIASVHEKLAAKGAAKDGEARPAQADAKGGM